MREYRVKVTVRNNLLLSAIENAGYKTQAEFARFAGLTPSEVNALTAMRDAPINADGVFSPTAKTLMEVLGACPTDLWTEEQLTMSLRRNTVEKEMSREAVMMALDDNCQNRAQFKSGEELIEQEDLQQAMLEMLDTLTPREAKVLKLRFGIETDNDQTLEQVGSMFKTSRENVRRIEAKALRKMRAPFRADQLKPYLLEE